MAVFAASTLVSAFLLFQLQPMVAKAILAWFDLHGASESGEVPFKAWPQAMRGHFIARFPPVKS